MQFYLEKISISLHSKVFSKKIGIFIYAGNLSGHQKRSHFLPVSFVHFLNLKMGYAAIKWVPDSALVEQNLTQYTKFEPE